MFLFSFWRHVEVVLLFCFHNGTCFDTSSFFGAMNGMNSMMGRICLRFSEIVQMHDSQSTTLVQDLSTNYMRYLDLFLTSGAFSYSIPMLEVLSAVTGESVAVFEHEELADASVKALKQCLAKKLGIPRFRLRRTGWRSNLDQRSRIHPSSGTACDAGVSAAWQGARSEHHGGMSGEWWQASWAALEPAAKSQFWKCKCNDAPVCCIPQWKSQMRVFTDRSRCQQRPTRNSQWINTSLLSS